MSKVPLLSLIVATRGRATPFQVLFKSLEAQSCKDFEVIIVDQNVDERAGTPAAEGWSFPIIHLRTPFEMGLSRARNSGLVPAKGSIVLFPDDDCWYPPHFLAHAVARMGDFGADVLTGRACDDAGRDINGRYEKVATRIERSNVFTAGIEWVAFFKRSTLDAVGGYNVDIGVGATTPWQACEGQDIVLRALAAGFVCVFDPTVYGHHAELDIADPSMQRKGRSYARGLGYVLRLHHYSVTAAANWIARPMIRALLSLMRRDLVLFGYYRNVALGRLEGWRMTLSSRSPATPSTGGALGLSKNC